MSKSMRGIHTNHQTAQSIAKSATNGLWPETYLHRRVPEIEFESFWEFDVPRTVSFQGPEFWHRKLHKNGFQWHILIHFVDIGNILWNHLCAKTKFFILWPSIFGTYLWFLVANPPTLLVWFTSSAGLLVPRRHSLGKRRDLACGATAQVGRFPQSHLHLGPNESVAKWPKLHWWRSYEDLVGGDWNWWFSWNMTIWWFTIGKP